MKVTDNAIPDTHPKIKGYPRCYVSLSKYSHCDKYHIHNTKKAVSVLHARDGHYNKKRSIPLERNTRLTLLHSLKNAREVQISKENSSLIKIPMREREFSHLLGGNKYLKRLSIEVGTFKNPSSSLLQILKSLKIKRSFSNLELTTLKASNKIIQYISKIPSLTTLKLEIKENLEKLDLDHLLDNTKLTTLNLIYPAANMATRPHLDPRTGGVSWSRERFNANISNSDLQTLAKRLKTDNRLKTLYLNNPRLAQCTLDKLLEAFRFSALTSMAIQLLNPKDLLQSIYDTLINRSIDCDGYSLTLISPNKIRLERLLHPKIKGYPRYYVPYSRYESCIPFVSANQAKALLRMKQVYHKKCSLLQQIKGENSQEPIITLIPDIRYSQKLSIAQINRPFLWTKMDLQNFVYLFKNSKHLKQLNFKNNALVFPEILPHLRKKRFLSEINFLEIELDKKLGETLTKYAKYISKIPNITTLGLDIRELQSNYALANILKNAKVPHLYVKHKPNSKPKPNNLANYGINYGNWTLFSFHPEPAAPADFSLSTAKNPFNSALKHLTQQLGIHKYLKSLYLDNADITLDQLQLLFQAFKENNNLVCIQVRLDPKVVNDLSEILEHNKGFNPNGQNAQSNYDKQYILASYQISQIAFDTIRLEQLPSGDKASK